MRRRSVRREQREVTRHISGRALDGQLRIVQTEDLSARKKPSGDTAVREGSPHAVKVFRMGIRKRLEENGAQRGEDRCRGADAEGQRSDGREWESRRTAEGAEGNAEILQNGFHFWTPDFGTTSGGPASACGGRVDTIVGRQGRNRLVTDLPLPYLPRREDQSCRSRLPSQAPGAELCGRVRVRFSRADAGFRSRRALNASRPNQRAWIFVLAWDREIKRH